jgi:uncharacterized repeat protein (TIGR01451 family)
MAFVALVAALLGTPAVAAAAANFSTTYISASQQTLAPGQQLTMTVALRNTGNATGIADVTSPLPVELSLVKGSITYGGKLIGSSIVWDNVRVNAGKALALTYRVQQAKPATRNVTISVKATIATTNARFVRDTLITLTPNLSPAPASLSGSSKTAGKSTVAYGEKLTYTITVRNTAKSSTVVSVSDPVPDRLSYVNGSATLPKGASLSFTNGTLTWSNVNIPAGGSVTLRFQVTPSVRVIAPSQLVNNALITSGSVTFARSVTVIMTMLPV